MARITLLTLAAAAAVAAFLLPSGSAPAKTTVGVTLRDFSVTPSRHSARAGSVTFRVRNRAQMEHELVVIRTSRRASRLPTTSSGAASERGKVGETKLGGGATKRLTVRLRKGHYALICNIDGHYAAGMRADFTVR